MKYGPALLLAFGLSACANIDAVPLDATGGPKKDAVHGIRYYVPAPYILITDLPTPTTGGDDNPKGPRIPGTGMPGAHTAATGTGSSKPKTDGTGDIHINIGTDSSAKGNTTDPTKATTPSSPPSASPADVSFQAAGGGRTIKLVYLPDFSQPMALQMHPGIFGNTSMSASLQDGWMLTSINGTADSGGPAALQALASLVGSVAGIATGSAPAGAAVQKAAPKVPSATELLSTNLDTNVMATYYQQGLKIGLGTTRPYTEDELNMFVASDKAESHPGRDALEQILKGISVGLGTPLPDQSLDAFTTPQLIASILAFGSLADAKNPATDILPAGLYKLDFSGSGYKLVAVTIFCSSGVKQSGTNCGG